MRSGTKPGPTVTRQRSKAAARALRRRDLRMGQASERRPVVESSRRQPSRNSTKGSRARSALPLLPDGEKLWWMIAVPSRELLRRVPFVIGVMGLLAVGLAATLWLATRSTEDSSTLSAMRLHNRELQQEQERLERSMEQGQSVTELARRAGDLGMVPSRDVAKLVPQPDGSVQVFGQLRPAEGAPESPLDAGPAKPDDPAKKQPPPAPSAPAAPNDAATSNDAAPAPVEPDDSVERVRPTQIEPAAPAQIPPGGPEQPPVDAPAPPLAASSGNAASGSAAPNNAAVPPPADSASPMSQAGNQSPVVPLAPQADNPVPPALEAPEPVASQPNAPGQPEQIAQPEQEPHE